MFVDMVVSAHSGLLGSPLKSPEAQNRAKTPKSIGNHFRHHHRHRCRFLLLIPPCVLSHSPCHHFSFLAHSHPSPLHFQGHPALPLSAMQTNTPHPYGAANHAALLWARGYAGAVRALCGRCAGAVRALCGLGAGCAGAVRALRGLSGGCAAAVRALCGRCAGAVRALCGRCAGLCGRCGGGPGGPGLVATVNH